jgi:hypothetical protein
MTTILICALAALGLFAGVLLCLRVGWRLGRKRHADLGEDGHAGLGALEGSVYGLMGLLIAFTFTGAAARFQNRRELVTQHVNAAGTAWLRTDLLEGSTQAEVRGLLREYVDALLVLGTSAGDPPLRIATVEKLGKLQEHIWSRLIAATRANPAAVPPVAILPPFNDLFDLTTIRIQSAYQHPPMAIYLMLGVLVLVSALFAGFGMAKTTRQSWLHLVAFSAVLALAVYLILDLEFPRLGLIRVTSADQAFVELRATMK